MIILCVDDAPERYRRFLGLMLEHGDTVAVGHTQEFVDLYLTVAPDQIAAVCLDHDMPDRTGAEYARDVFGHLSYPVVITSANPVGAQRIEDILTEFGTPCIQIPPYEGWEEKARDWLIETWTLRGWYDAED